MMLVSYIYFDTLLIFLIFGVLVYCFLLPFLCLSGKLIRLCIFLVPVMWKFNPFTPREPTTLEGRYVDVGNIKVYVRNAIAEGGFSCVYLARDVVNTSKQYALKHIICNDGESLELVVKEVSVMKMLRGHPNVVTLVAHTILDMGRTKEALLVMEFCDKSLVNVLEKRGTAYFKEKDILSIFRDVCNAVFAMHSQSPPIAHRYAVHMSSPLMCIFILQVIIS